MRQKSGCPKTPLYKSMALSILLLGSGCEGAGPIGNDEPAGGKETGSNEDMSGSKNGQTTSNNEELVVPEEKIYFDQYVEYVKPEIDYVHHRFDLVWHENWISGLPDDHQINFDAAIQNLKAIESEYSNLRNDLRRIQFNDQDPYIHHLEAYRSKMDKAILYRIDAAYKAREVLESDILTYEMYIGSMSSYEYEGQVDPYLEAALQELRNYEEALKGS
ncbi:hypothetical protein [Planococcus shenhongbingii]|uniref:Uncharacterized protein n=1 Tax=Planococcus shenhongbingii TaxID=3058398 RepID=A0ABT8NA71_9BACL|nr:hypothetical protein [Planococcus sp. N017]MDN7244658.1 hypothetical protein [Planococcus sp. N017]